VPDFTGFLIIVFTRRAASFPWGEGYGDHRACDEIHRCGRGRVATHAAGPLGRVIAVEPDKDNHDLLSRNLEACTNGRSSTKRWENRDGTVNLYQTDENRGALSTSDILGVGEERATKVRMRRGDAIMAELGARPRIAKIDVEGAEPSVMQGLGDHLPPILLFEMCRGS